MKRIDFGSFSIGSEAERWRCRWCFGCKYFQLCGENGTCGYYLETGQRRGTTFGVGPCPKKKLRNDWTPPKGYDEFCRSKPPKGYQMDRMRTTLKKPGDELAAVKAKQKEKRRRIGWDADYAFWLFRHGWKKSDISIAVGVGPETLYNYSAKQNWGVQDVEKLPKKKKSAAEIRLAADRKWRPPVIRGPEDEPPKEFKATSRNNEGRVQWDTLRAYELWLDGWLFPDIAEVLGCNNGRQICNYAAAHGWSVGIASRSSDVRRRTPEEIEAEKRKR